MVMVGSHPSAEIQSVYLTAEIVWAAVFSEEKEHFLLCFDLF